MEKGLTESAYQARPRLYCDSTRLPARTSRKGQVGGQRKLAGGGGRKGRGGSTSSGEPEGQGGAAQTRVGGRKGMNVS